MNTECRQEGEYLVVETVVSCAGGLSLSYRTLWSMSNEEKRLTCVRIQLRIGHCSLELASGPVPVEHVTCVRQFVVPLFDEQVTVDVQVPDVSCDFQSVFLAKREEGCEVFVDETSARFWAGASSDVMRVSVRAASSALKTDEESIRESAITSTRITWQTIHTCISLLDAAEPIRKRLIRLGIVKDAVCADMATKNESFSHQ